jgi:hypothetical protein
MSMSNDDRPLLLDLYCCAGGIAVGFHRAGFDVIGVDIVDRPNYPFTFVRADALDVLDDLGRYGFAMPDAINTAPPCQEGHPQTESNRQRGNGGTHQQLVPATREALIRTGLPYIIEQPTTNRRNLIRRDLTLCMDMFYPPDYPPPWVQRHRSFELSGFTVPQPYHPTYPNMVGQHRGYVRGWRHGVNRLGAEAPYIAAYGKGGGKGTEDEIRHAMMIEHPMSREEMIESVPAAFGEYIGDHLMFSLVNAGRLDHSGVSTWD